jgi:hypothetical protein
MAVRILLPLTLRECDGVRGELLNWLSRSLDRRLVLRTGPNWVGLVDIGRGGGSSPVASVRETGEDRGVEEAIVPPTPVREMGGVIFSGALRVIEQLVGITAADGVIRAGLYGEPIAMTKGTLESDAVLNLRSGGGGDWIGWSFVADAADPALRRSVGDDMRAGELTALSRVSATGGGATRTFDELELLCCGFGAVSWRMARYIFRYTSL